MYEISREKRSYYLYLKFLHKGFYKTYLIIFHSSLKYIFISSVSACATCDRLPNRYSVCHKWCSFKSPFWSLALSISLSRYLAFSISHSILHIPYFSLISSLSYYLSLPTSLSRFTHIMWASHWTLPSSLRFRIIRLISENSDNQKSEPRAPLQFGDRRKG